MIWTYVTELLRYGIPEVVGPVDREVLFLLDGVGGFQIELLMVRRALRAEDGGGTAPPDLGTVLFKWQFGLPGDISTDLMWLRRNRLMGLKLARKLLAFRRAHPDTHIHLLAFSGGAGIALFACERLGGRGLLDTLILACPAMSPEYNLAPALQAVSRCYAMVSHKDRWVLGLGTRLFGTTDRRFVRAAGLVGFRMPKGLSNEETRLYERLREIHWSERFIPDGHHGGHAGWAGVRFLRRHLLPMLRGEPRLPTREVKPA